MAIKIDNNVKNQGKAPAMLTGLDSGKPTAGQNGRLYYATDTKIIYIDNGSTWVVFLQSAGGTISVTPNYIAKADASGNLIASAFYQDPTTGNVALNNNATTKGKLTITDNANRVIFGIVNVSNTGDDKTGEVRFYGYDGSTVSTLGQIYQTNDNQVNTNAFKNSINIKANLPNGTITFIVGGDTSANIKGFIDNNGIWVIGSLATNGFYKLQVTGGIFTDSLNSVSGNNYMSLNSGGLNLVDDNTGYVTDLGPDYLNIYNFGYGASITKNQISFSTEEFYNAYFNLTTLFIGNNDTEKTVTLTVDNLYFTDNGGNNRNTTLSAAQLYLRDITNGHTARIDNEGIVLALNNSSIFSAGVDSTKIKALDLGTYSNAPMVSIGFTPTSGYKNNRGTITYTGGTLLANGTVTCTITFMGTYPSIPFGYVTNTINVNGTHILYSVIAITASSMTITCHNLGLTTIPNNTIRFNYLVIL